MGFVTVKVTLGSADKSKLRELDFVVDTGSFYPILPPSLAHELGIEPMAEIELLLADKSRVKAGASFTFFKVLDREGVFPVAILDSPQPLLGAIVLEGLGIKVDPATERLEYSRPYGIPLL